MISDQFIQCSIFGTITFFESDFKRIDFTGSIATSKTVDLRT